MGVLVVLSGYNVLLAHAFSAPDNHVGGNFSYVACSLAHGGEYWDTCPRLFASEIREGRIADIDQFFYGEATRAFEANPTVLIRRMLSNMWGYVHNLPDLLLFQYLYDPIVHIHDMFIYPFFILLVPGWFYMVKQERDLAILSFGFVLLVSTVLSAAVVFSTDGPRTMHVTHPFIAMILATGFSAPLSLRAPDDRPILSWRSGIGAIGALTLVFLLGPPLISHLVRSPTAFGSNVKINTDDLRIVPGGRFMTGFLVLPDAADLPRKEPALHASTFARMIPLYSVDPEPRLSELLPQAPFALLYSPAQNSPDTLTNYLTPSTVLTDKLPRHWLFRLGRRSSTLPALPDLGFFSVVEEAKPIE